MRPPRLTLRRAALLLVAVTLLCGLWLDSRAARQSNTGNAASKGGAKKRVARRGAPRKRRQARPEPAATGGYAVVGPVGPPGSPTSNVNAGEEPPPPPPRPAATPTKRKVIVSGGVLNSKVVHKVQPEYPAIAKAARASGTVTVQIVVGEDGSVISATAVSGHPLLQQAAVNAVRQWKFSPTRLSGQPVKVSGVVTVNFKLDSKPPGPVA